MNDKRYEIGDKLRCIPGFNTSSAGAGYEENKIITVRRIDEANNPDQIIYWPEKNPDLGIYGKALYLIDYVINDYKLY